MYISRQIAWCELIHTTYQVDTHIINGLRSGCFSVVCMRAYTPTRPHAQTSATTVPHRCVHYSVRCALSTIPCVQLSEQNYYSTASVCMHTLRNSGQQKRPDARRHPANATLLRVAQPRAAIDQSAPIAWHDDPAHVRLKFPGGNDTRQKIVRCFIQIVRCIIMYALYFRQRPPTFTHHRLPKRQQTYPNGHPLPLSRFPRVLRQTRAL